MGAPPYIKPGEDATKQLHFGYVARWNFEGAKPSDDPAAIAFGPKRWPLRQGLIRPVLMVGERDLGDDDRKPVVYLPIKRVDGKDQVPTLILSIALVPTLGGNNVTVPIWVGSQVEVKIVNLFRVNADGTGDTLTLTGTLTNDLTCNFRIPPADVSAWMQKGSKLELAVNDNLLDFQFKMSGVDDNGQPLKGQSKNRLFLYCRKTVVFLPGLFASKVQFTTLDGATIGYPDWWDEELETPESGPAFNAKWQRADVLECDDRGMPLLPCPKPSLLMLGGPVNLLGRLGVSVIDPFNSLHNARLAMLPRIPEKFLLYKLIIHPYDWRCDLTDAAATLLNRLTELKTAKTGLSNQPDTDDLVAIMGHSTGGVVIRRALAPVAPQDCSPELEPAVKTGTRLSADRLIGQVFFLSVPFSGAPKAASVLATGLAAPTGSPQIPFLVPESLVAVSLSMPIVYHLHTSSQYKHRPSTSPSSPRRLSPAATSNEVDKAAFVTDMIEGGWMPRPWMVKASAATDPALRRKLATESQAWHQLIAERHLRESGRIMKYVMDPASLAPWFDAQVAARGLQAQRTARKEPSGWNAYLAGRAKSFHDKSATALTGYWKDRSCIFWGACRQTPTLRQLNLTKESTTYASIKEFFDARPWLASKGVDAVASGIAYNDPGNQGGSVRIEQWKLEGRQFIATQWKLEWVGQVGTGDGTVPSDSQLAELDKVAANFNTIDEGEAPQHMDSTKSPWIWYRLVRSLHNDHMAPMNGPESRTNIDRVMPDPPLDALYMLY